MRQTEADFFLFGIDVWTTSQIEVEPNAKLTKRYEIPAGVHGTKYKQLHSMRPKTEVPIPPAKPPTNCTKILKENVDYFL